MGPGSSRPGIRRSRFPRWPTPSPRTRPALVTRSARVSSPRWRGACPWNAPRGNLMAVHALEATGPQEYDLKPGPLADRFAVAYGDAAAAEVAEHLPS